MATIVLAAAGAAAGASFGGGILGLSSVVIGRAVGATLGRVIDQSIMGSGSEAVEAGRVDRFRLTSAGEGTAIPQLFGRMRVGAQVIWASDFVEHVETSGGGSGKGAPAQPEVRQYSYSISVALALCEGVISRVGRIWADGNEIDPNSIDMRVYNGSDTQLCDPLIDVEMGRGNTPAYRGLAYVVIENLQLAAYGNRLPQFTFEVIRTQQQTDGAQQTDMSRQVRAVALMPGTGEYALATTPVRLRRGFGDSTFVNVNTPLGKTDFAASLNALTGELPRCGSTSLIVSWFGDDLRCDTCTIRPKVEQRSTDGIEMPWTAGGIGREAAEEIPSVDGDVIYGGTPADRSVVEAIRALNEAGQKVMFYPFILMDQLAGNNLPDPQTGDGEQSPLPWRGRIALASGPEGENREGTAAADAAVSAFFGSARVSDFTIGSGERSIEDGDTRSLSEGEIGFAGVDEWRYRRFVLHYAHLCALAGGVDSFCIGSEMRGLTTIRGERGFPAVDEMIRLAADVRTILGADTKISYAADWSEYFGFHPQDGSNDVYFHLDPLWADANIDFIGIDNYMPLSDWRNEPDEADAGAGSIYNLEYLKGNIAGGEGYDWFYRSAEADKAQDRSEITDGTYGEPWVFRYKDLKSWWSKPHHERRGGVRLSEPTRWVPKSKPIWFTELGCAAIDKGTNQPNKFLDPKSSESALPRYSDGRRDDYIQLQYLRAMHEYWDDRRNNPRSDLYGGLMIDMDRAHVWAWDARPYPFFPGNASLWSDAANYARGHWITGRSGSRALASVVREICKKSGIDKVDVDKLHGVLRGYTITDLGDARRALQPLMLAFGFDAIERDGTLIFKSRDRTVSAEIDPEWSALSDEFDGDVVSVRTPEAERIGKLKLVHVGADGNFETRSAEAIHPADRHLGVSQSELPISLTEGEARAIAERWLSESRVSRDKVKFALPPTRLDIGAGDVVRIRDSLYRVDHVDRGSAQTLDAVRIEPDIYDPAQIQEEPLRLTRYVAPTPPEMLFLDIPALNSRNDVYAPFVAASSAAWPGPINVYSSPEDAGFVLNTEIPGPAVIGVTENDMKHAGPGQFDRGRALRVRLLRGSLERVSMTALLSGANAMAIGSGESDPWEIFQFQEAKVIGPRTYELSNRLRGQLGTDGIVPQVWPAGSRVILLNDNLRQLDLALAERGLEKIYRFGPASKPIGDASYQKQALAFDGAGLRPYRPVHLRTRRSGGATLVSWIRRTRVDGDSWQGAEVPLGEESEAYTIRIIAGGRVRRTEAVSRPQFEYSEASRLADGVVAPFEVQVCQVSMSYGEGPSASVTVSR